MSNQPSIVKNAFYKGLLNVFNLIIPIIITPYIYRVLAPNAMGEFDYTSTIFNYFHLCGMLGISTYGIRELSRNRDNKEKVRKTYSMLFTIGIISNLLIFAIFMFFTFALFGNQAQKLQLFLILSLNLFANFFNTEWINEAFEDFKFIAIKTAIIRMLYVVCIFIFVRKPDDIWKYATLIVASNFINYIISFFYSHKYTQFNVFSIQLDYGYIKKTLPILLSILILENSGVFYTVLDKVMLGSYGNPEAVACYSVGQKITEICKALLMTLTLVSLPRLSYYLGKDKGMYAAGLKSLFNTVLMLSIPMGIGLYVLSDYAVLLFAGDQYDDAILPLTVFSLRIIFMLLENMTSQQVLFLHGKERLVAFFNISWGVVNLILNFLLVHFDAFTPTTAIASTLCCDILLTTTETLYIRYKLKFTLFRLKSIKYLLFALLFIPISGAARNMMSNDLLTVATIIVLCTGSYMLCLTLTRDEAFASLYAKVRNLNKPKGQSTEGNNDN